MSPDLPVIGTKASNDMTTGSFHADKLKSLKKQVYKERDAREAQGKGDRWSEMQELNVPELIQIWLDSALRCYLNILMMIEGD